MDLDYQIYKIEPGDWESATGKTVDKDVMVRVLPGESWRCEWTYNDEYERWDTECEDVAVDQNNESPKDFGFKFCPYCGKAIEWNESENLRSQFVDGFAREDWICERWGGFTYLVIGRNDDFMLDFEDGILWLHYENDSRDSPVGRLFLFGNPTIKQVIDAERMFGC
jgi:hypothetical protein